MDLKALQMRLREFAAARDWQPFHSPKNLAMALMVEAAELLELFQWLTTEQSNTLTRHSADKEHVGDEIADVLLYLLQLADYTGVDVEEAVERKLRKNAQKHPAKHAERAAPGPKGHLLIDWENVQPRAEELRKLVPEGTDVWLFHGPKQKVDASSHRLAYGASRVTLIPRPDVAKKNALDFQLSYYIGYISARWPKERFVVVSNDTGFDPMLEHARELGFDAKRCEVRRPQPVAKPIANPGKPPPGSAPAARTQSAFTAVNAALVSQVAESASSNLRFIAIADRPREEAAVLEYFRLFIPKDVEDTDALARSAWTLLLDRGDLLAPHVEPSVLSWADRSPAPEAAEVNVTSPTPLAPAKPAIAPYGGQSKVRPAKKALPAPPGSSIAQKATRQEVQRLGKALQTIPSAQRPANKEALMAWLQSYLGEIGTVSSRVVHALAQLQAQKHVVIEGEKVRYSPKVQAVSQADALTKPAAPAKKAASQVKAVPGQPTAAQIALAVIASLKKMPENKPTRRVGLLKFIETHSSKAADPKAMAQRVCALLEARNDVADAVGKQGIIYPKLQVKRASSA